MVCCDFIYSFCVTSFSWTCCLYYKAMPTPCARAVILLFLQNPQVVSVPACMCCVFLPPGPPAWHSAGLRNSPELEIHHLSLRCEHPVHSSLALLDPFCTPAHILMLTLYPSDGWFCSGSPRRYDPSSFGLSCQCRCVIFGFPLLLCTRLILLTTSIWWGPGSTQ